jgi:zinc and cadmium transporter
MEAYTPYLLVVAASSFLYIAVSDLIPRMHERPALADALPQLLLVGLGVLVIHGVTILTHAH